MMAPVSDPAVLADADDLQAKHFATLSDERLVENLRFGPENYAEEYDDESYRFLCEHFYSPLMQEAANRIGGR